MPRREPDRTRTPKTPREFSGLPSPKFSDRECAAYQWLWDRGIRPWLVDLADKTVDNGKKKYKGLIEYAQHHGWEG